MSPMSQVQGEPRPGSPGDDSTSVEITYGPHYYEHDYGPPYERSEFWLTFFGAIADRIVKELQPRSVLDVGCAMGLLVEQLYKRGVDAWGMDVSKYAISRVHESVSDRCRVGSILEPIEGRYDLVVCIEVVEHLWPKDAHTVIANLSAAGERVLFSSSPSHYGEPTHLNTRPPEYWSTEFAEHGLFRNLDHDASYIAPWSVLYDRQGANLRDLVRNYDRAYWRLSDEVAQRRTTIVELHERLESLAGTPQVKDEIEARDRTIFDLRERILTMRDAIMGLEASNGVLAGERDMYFSQLAARDAAVAQLQAILESRTWRTAWKLMGPYRRLRRRGDAD